MGRYAAKLSIGWQTGVFEGDEPWEIILAASDIQDFDCLLMMGSMYETSKGKKELAKLRDFLSKYHDETLTMEDIKNLDIKLSAGDIICLGIAETEEEIEALKENM